MSRPDRICPRESIVARCALVSGMNRSRRTYFGSNTGATRAGFGVSCRLPGTAVILLVPSRWFSRARLSTKPIALHAARDCGRALVSRTALAPAAKTGSSPRPSRPCLRVSHTGRFEEADRDRVKPHRIPSSKRAIWALHGPGRDGSPFSGWPCESWWRRPFLPDPAASVTFKSCSCGSRGPRAAVLRG